MNANNVIVAPQGAGDFKKYAASAKPGFIFNTD
jgi:hypothetical protein